MLVLSLMLLYLVVRKCFATILLLLLQFFLFYLRHSNHYCESYHLIEDGLKSGYYFQFSSVYTPCQSY